MLSFRMMLFCGLAGICLWGLFDLLGNLKQPELLRTAKAVVVKGCEPAQSQEAIRLCPQLYCQKALLESKAVEVRSRFDITVDKTYPEVDSTRLIGGLARRRDDTRQAFACLLDGHKVTASAVLEPRALEELAQQPGRWQL